MNSKTEKIRKFRLFILQQIEGLSSKQLNLIPEGFNNNIIWNLGHLLAVMQCVCYKRAGLPPVVEDKYYTPFLPGTKPCSFINDPEIDQIKKLFISVMDILETDLKNNRFTAYTKSQRLEEIFGISVTNIDDAIDFTLYHNGYHSGTIMALKNLV